MILPDVNVLLAAHREELPDHPTAHKWLTKVLSDDEPVAIPDFVLVAVYRLATTPSIFNPPSSTDKILGFIEAVRTAPAAMPIRAGTKSWSKFGQLAKAQTIRGAASTDAMIAALCYEHGCTLYTYAQGFSRFPGLRYTRPSAW